METQALTVGLKATDISKIWPGDKSEHHCDASIPMREKIEGIGEKERTEKKGVPKNPLSWD